MNLQKEPIILLCRGKKIYIASKMIVGGVIVEATDNFYVFLYPGQMISNISKSHCLLVCELWLNKVTSGMRVVTEN